MLTMTFEHPVRRLSLLAAGGFAVLLLSSCATYHSLPLAHAAARAGTPARWNALAKAASELKHPLLKPLVITGTGGFSPDEIAVLAVVASPDLRALRDQRGLAQAQVIQAGILPNPQLGFSLDKPHGNSDPTLVTGRTLGLDWDVYSLLTRNNRLAAAKAAAKAVDLDVAWQEWQTAQAARLDAFRILSIQRQLPLARKIEHMLDDTTHILEVAAGQHEVTDSDVAAAVDSAQRARMDRQDLERQLRLERAQLNLILGVPVGENVPLKPAPAFPAFPAEEAGLATLLHGLTSRRLDLLALKAGYASQDAALRAEIKNQFPRFALGIHRGRDTSDIKSVGFSVSIELPLFDRNQAGVAAAEASRRQLFDEYTARVAQARAEVATIAADLDATNRQVAELRSTLPSYARLASSSTHAFLEHELNAPSEHEASIQLAQHLLDLDRLDESRIELAVALETVSARPLLNRDL